MSEMLVLGLGKSGVAAAAHGLKSGEKVTIYAGKKTESTLKSAKPFEDQGVCVIFDSEDVQGAYDLCVACPGIPQTGAFYKSAQCASKELVSEPEYAWRLSPENWIAITGTNGKTTTTSLIAYLLQHAGLAASACGNIGDTCVEAVENRKEGECLVAEMSSYQLASTKDFAPRSAVLLNITPDHISWHGGFDNYAQAKLEVFANMKPGGCAVVCDGIEQCDEAFAEDLRSRGIRLITVGAQREENCAWCEDGVLNVKLGSKAIALCPADDMKIKGSHNIENALCAAAVALDYGICAADVVDGLKTFAPLEHRIEPSGEVNGVSFYNDSKATNVDATLKALTAFKGSPMVLLLGGRDKGTDLSELVEACQEPCRCVITYGEAGPRFNEAFSVSPLPTYEAKGMREAFQLACELAQPGDAVVLSPACASFDEFNSFGHRGEVFKELVAGLQD